MFGQAVWVAAGALVAAGVDVVAVRAAPADTGEAELPAA